MDEQTLRIFLSLAETQNTRDTAAELRINQSNVSRALARLEDEVGMALFSRHGKRLELNANGLAFPGPMRPASSTRSSRPAATPS